MVIERIGNRYKYYLTELGGHAVIIGLKLREFFLLQRLAASAPMTALSG